MKRLKYRSVVLLWAMLAVAAAACSEGTHRADETSAGIGVISWKTGVSRGEYLALPDSTRLDTPRPGGGSSVEPGVAVEVDVRLGGFRGGRVPLDYSLHDAHTGQALAANTIRVTPDVHQWRRRAYVWLPTPGRGRYYVQVALNDTTGGQKGGPRTPDFTVE